MAISAHRFILWGLRSTAGIATPTFSARMRLSMSLASSRG
jgi:hypothetical protein